MVVGLIVFVFVAAGVLAAAALVASWWRYGLVVRANLAALRAASDRRWETRVRQGAVAPAHVASAAPCPVRARRPDGSADWRAAA